jgi:hypothetical protein
MPRNTRRSSTTKQPPSASTSGEQAIATHVSSTHRSKRNPQRDPQHDPLVGRFFHSFHPESKYPDAPTPIVKWQGYVLGRVDDHTYLIELFSGFGGEPNGQQLQPLAGMADWKFYSNARDMEEWYTDEYCPRVRTYSFEAAE